MTKTGSGKRMSRPVEKLEYEDLVEMVRGTGRDKRKNQAYNEIEKRVKLKITYIVGKFYIPGLNYDDILQEALFALRFKAIPDYNKDKGTGTTPYPFDNFAILCIRRHLSTILKSSFQNKRKALNTSLSLDENRGSHDDEDLYLSDIVPHIEGNIIEMLGEKEYYKNLFNKLYVRLSKLEKNVFILYAYKYSYDEITDKINKDCRAKGSKKRVSIKSIDNSLSRIKIKAKEIFEKFGKKNNS